MRRGVLLGVFLFAEMTNCWGMTSEVYTKVSKEYAILSNEFQKMAMQLFRLKSQLKKKDPELGWILEDSIGSLMNGVSIQMGKAGVRKGNFALGTTFMMDRIENKAVANIEIVRKAIDLSREVVHAKIYNEILSLELRVVELFSQILSKHFQKVKEPSEKYKQAFEKIREEEMKIMPLQVQNLCKESSNKIVIFIDKSSKKNKWLEAALQGVVSEVFGLLIQIFNIMKQENYKKRLADAIGSCIKEFGEEIDKKFEFLEEEIEKENKKIMDNLLVEIKEKNREVSDDISKIIEIANKYKQLQSLIEPKLKMWLDEKEDIQRGTEKAKNAGITTKLEENILPRVNKLKESILTSLENLQDKIPKIEYENFKKKMSEDISTTLKKIDSDMQAYFEQQKNEYRKKKLKEKDKNIMIARINLEKNKHDEKIRNLNNEIISAKKYEKSLSKLNEVATKVTEFRRQVDSLKRVVGTLVE